MARPRRLWFRKQTKTWHVQIEGKQHNLRTEDTAEAETKYYELMLERPEEASNEQLFIILDKFLEWVQMEQPRSCTWYIQSFVDKYQGAGRRIEAHSKSGPATATPSVPKSPR